MSYYMRIFCRLELKNPSFFAKTQNSTGIFYENLELTKRLTHLRAFRKSPALTGAQFFYQRLYDFYRIFHFLLGILFTERKAQRTCRLRYGQAHRR